MKRIHKISISMIVLLLLTILSLYPFYIMLVGSFKSQMALSLVPADLNPFRNLIFINWEYVIFKSNIWNWLLNSVFISSCVTALNVFIASTAGYAFAKKSFRGKTLFFSIIIATMILPRQMLLIPNYLVADKLLLTGKTIGLILTSLAPAFGIFLCRQFMKGIPTELIEAAEIDGCSEIRKFTQIIVPLALPAMGALAIFTFLACWNDYLWQLIMITDESKYTIPIGVATFAQVAVTNYGRQLTVAVIATIPILTMFLSFQKVFIKGITMGGVKG